MSELETPYTFKIPLLNRALHFDFLRLRCGTEEAFHQAVVAMHPALEGRPLTFVAMSEWDAVVMLPATELYPEVLTRFYDNYDIDSKIAGTAGYFGYLWDHELNKHLDSKLKGFQECGIGLIISLRFEDWVRRELGLGAEILFCDWLQRHLAQRNAAMPPEPREPLSALVAHTLGWNDIVCVLHAQAVEDELLRLQSEMRLLTLRDLLPPDADAARFINRYDQTPIFAASYTHLIGGYEALIRGNLAMGKLAEWVLNARLLVRVAPALEWRVRREIERLSGNEVLAADMPTEMGHYTFSADITGLVKKHGGVPAMKLLSDIRSFIGQESATETEPKVYDSYAETTTA
jgi:hypothetical protein